MYFSTINKHWQPLAVIMALIGILSLSCPAAEMEKPSNHLLDTNQIIGELVTSTQAKPLGIISDIVIKADDNRVSYVVLARGGFAGLGQTLYAIPLSEFMFQDGKVRLNRTPSELDKWQGFDDEHWPVTANRLGSHADKDVTIKDEKSDKDMDSESKTINPTHLRTQRISMIIGLNVVDKQAAQLGSLENFVIDTESGELEYAIISYGGILGVGSHYSAVPVKTLRVQANPRSVLFSGDRSKIEATMIDRGDVRNFMVDAPQRDRIDSQFSELDWLTNLLDGGDKSLSTVIRDNTVWAPGSTYNSLYDPKTEMSVVGRIESIGVFYPTGNAEGADSGARLRVRVGDNQVLTVHAGPLSSLRQRHIDLRPKMAVTVFGSKVFIENNEIVMARAIEFDGTMYHLRDEEGKPMWVLDDMLTKIQ